MNFIKKLKWRYATKKFDKTKKVTEEQLDLIKTAVQLSPSSYGLQPYVVLNIQDPEVREQLKPACWGQSPVTEASHLFIFCHKTNVEAQDIKEYLEMKAQKNGLKKESLDAYFQFVQQKLSEKSSIEMFHWTAKQAYIALSNAITACTELNIDSLPMEGFEAGPVNEILGLGEKNLNACTLLAIGYRHEADKTQSYHKVRKPISTLFKDI